jgi:hypothetical protein
MRSHTFKSCISVLAVCAQLSSCSLTKFITRTEKENYHIVHRDTTVIERVHNLPGTTQDTSHHPAPSSRTTEIVPYTSERDSIIPHTYPNFLRWGVFEVAGVYAGGTGPGGGLLGAYGLADGGKIFTGEMIRIFPLEVRLRWFDDAPNWTFGTSAVEYWGMDNSLDHSFLTVVGLNQYVRRRFFLRDQIPYVIFQPYLGISEFPSAYLNIGGEFHVGSLGGLNLRAYAGLISGFDWGLPSVGGTFPYAAVGVSSLDYTNRLEETFREWYQYTRTTVGTTVLDGTGGSPNFYDARVASVEFPLPVGNRHAWIGTSFVHYMRMDTTSSALGVLPISAGYRQYLTDKIILEPAIEASYYPSMFVNAFLRIKTGIGMQCSIGGVAGFMTGSSGQLETQYNKPFGAPYFGLSLFVGDWDYTPEQIQKYRDDEIPSTMK